MGENLLTAENDRVRAQVEDVLESIRQKEGRGYHSSRQRFVRECWNACRHAKVDWFTTSRERNWQQAGLVSLSRFLDGAIDHRTQEISKTNNRTTLARWELGCEKWLNEHGGVQLEFEEASNNLLSKYLAVAYVEKDWSKVATMVVKLEERGL